jgi:hypothetical protein
MPITNEKLKNYPFLKGMFEDSYFPISWVEKGEQILVHLCEKIERQSPQTLEALYALTHVATEEFNTLQEDFKENGSEIETAARDCIGMDFSFIEKTYGFKVDAEELIATRDW